MIDSAAPVGARLSRADVMPLSVLTAATLLRTIPFLAFARFHFDSDQAVAGLMAIDLAHLRGVPLVLYGQSYLLAVIAWLAAPLFALFGPSVELLKAPFVPINLAYVFLLYVVLHSRAGLTRPSATLAAALAAVPTTVAASSFMNASGGHVEPLLYVMLLYVLRRRPVALGLIAAFAIVHREYMITALLALLVIDWLQLDPRRFSRKWLVSAIVIVSSAMAMRFVIRRFASNYRVSGPAYELTANARESLGWLWTHTSAILGLQRTDVHNLGLVLPHFEGSLASAAALALLAALAVFTFADARAWRRPLPDDKAPGLYLVVTCLFAAGAFAGKRLEHDPTLLRYLFLLVLLPSGLAAICFGWSRRKGVRQAAAVAAGVCLAGQLYSNVEYLRQLSRAHLVDTDGEVVAAMSERGLRYGMAPYWTAYKLAFRSGGSLHVASSDVVRIPAYQYEYRAHPRQGFRIGGAPCADGSLRLREVEICLSEPAR